VRELAQCMSCAYCLSDVCFYAYMKSYHIRENARTRWTHVVKSGCPSNIHLKFLLKSGRANSRIASREQCIHCISDVVVYKYVKLAERGCAKLNSLES